MNERTDEQTNQRTNRDDENEIITENSFEEIQWPSLHRSSDQLVQPNSEFNFIDEFYITQF